MSFHRNAKLGLAGRVALVRAIEGGCSLKAAAAAFNISPATAHRWWHRWLEASEEARGSLVCSTAPAESSPRTWCSSSASWWVAQTAVSSRVSSLLSCLSSSSTASSEWLLR